MMSQCRALMVTVWLLSIFQRISSFNLDTQNVLKKRGEANSLFGFSMAMHHQLKPSDQHFLLIGAPRAKAMPIQEANISGGLYRCKFTTQPDDCERITLDVEGKGREEEPHRENQWLGVRVKSQGRGGKVVTCAHRYQDWRYDNQKVLGKCFVMEQDLKLKAGEEDTRTFCKNRPAEKHMFGYCQQGLSVAFAKDRNYLVFGAPGAYEWKGTVQMEPVDNSLLATFETGDQRRGRFREELIPLGISSYLGYALDSGMNIIKKGELILVAGAPRSGHSGEVVLLKPDEKSEEKTLRVQHILKGPGLASSFGYDLVVLDLNSDQWDDIVVGAPQFSLKDMDKDVGGAVFVYINQGDAQSWDQIKPVALYGKRDSMFGLTVAHTGDINQDGYQDFAVSSPYEDSGKGRVYVYHGSRAGFLQKPQQVLQAGDSNVKLFGYSLASNMDVDNNGYPDLAVGSGSDSVLIYRAKPVVSIEKSLTLTPDRIDLKRQDCKTNPCIITAHSCFSYTAQPATYNPKMRIEYSLTADAVRKEWGFLPRMDIEGPALRFYELPSQGKKECIQTNLKLRGDLSDKLTSIFVDLSVSLPSDNPKQKFQGLPDLQPVLNTLQENTTKAEFIFMNTDCGSDNICQSNLQIQYRFCTKDQHQDECNPLNQDGQMPVISPGDENVALEVTITNKGGEDAHQCKLSVMFPEYLPLLSIVPKKNSKIQVQFNTKENRTLADCHLGNPFKSNSNASFYLLLNTDRLSLSVKEANVTMVLKTISIQNIPTVVAAAKIIFELHLEVLGLAKPSQLFFGGEVRDEKSIKSENDIGSLVQYEFRIGNTGRPLKSFASALLNIQWPKETKKGKQLLYLVQVTGREKKIIHCTPSEAIHPLKNIKVLPRSRREVGRESELEALSTDSGFLPFLGNSRKYKILTCADDLECVVIKCPLEAVDSAATIVLHSRLWNSTFLEEYSSLNYLDIVLNASLSLNGTVKNIGIRHSETKVRLTVFPEKKPALLSRVPWWVIFLSILTALMLTALLGYLLWKFLKGELCGGGKKNA